MLSKTFLFLVACLVVDCQAERDAPDAKARLRRLQRHQEQPEVPFELPNTSEALSGFTVVLTSDDANGIDEAQLTQTLHDYLKTGARADYPNTASVTLNGMDSQSQMEQSSTVDYTGNIEFASSSAPSVGDILALEQGLLLDIAAVQAAVDANSAIGQNVRVEQVAFSDKSAVALPGFSIVAIRNDSDPVDVAQLANPVDVTQLTTTLQDYLTAGILEGYPNAVAVVLDGNQSQIEQNTVVYTGHAIFSGTAPPVGDLQSLYQELLLDTTAVQAAMDANISIGQNVVVEQVVFEGSGGEDAPTGAVSIGGDDASDNNTAKIAGGLAGGIVFVLVLAGVAMKSKNPTSDEDKEPLTLSPPQEAPAHTAPPPPRPMDTYVPAGRSSPPLDYKDELRLNSLLIAKHTA
jgi:hypothetical protein